MIKILEEMSTTLIEVDGKREVPIVYVSFDVDIAIRKPFIKRFLANWQGWINPPNNIDQWAKWLIREALLLPLRLLGFKRPPFVEWARKGKGTPCYSIMWVGIKPDHVNAEGEEIR